MWENWDFICTKRSKTSSWRNNLATKLVSSHSYMHVENFNGGEQYVGNICGNLSICHTKIIIYYHIYIYIYTIIAHSFIE